MNNRTEDHRRPHQNVRFPAATVTVKRKPFDPWEIGGWGSGICIHTEKFTNLFGFMLFFFAENLLF